MQTQEIGRGFIIELNEVSTGINYLTKKSMNNFDVVHKCIITGLPIGLKKTDQFLSYSVQLNTGEVWPFTFCKKCFSRVAEGVRGKEYIIEGLIFNRKIKDFNSRVIHWDIDLNKCETPNPIDLKKEIDEGDYPRNPKQKFEHFFSWLFEKHKFDMIIATSLLTMQNAKINYFEDADELRLYFSAMKKDEMVEHIANSGAYRITYQGLNFQIRNLEEGFDSKKCFVAMAFQSNTKEIREAIRKALVETGYEPIFIDEKNISSEKTINDEIISNLKKCKFCIADFTYHKNGVYFESGFALGQGKPVIYTCQDEEFQKAHFDIKPLQHIIYRTPGELRERLVHKIEAWIKK